ncbi:MAG: hypothetical protein RXQ00_06240 [Caldivirga sp.]
MVSWLAVHVEETPVMGRGLVEFGVCCLVCLLCGVCAVISVINGFSGVVP